MEPVIADSSGLVALMKDDDSCHARALKSVGILVQKNADIVVPSEVLAETINILGKKLSNAAAVAAARSILGSSSFIVAGSSAEALLKAAEQLETHKNSTSFIDALVMTWAHDYSTKLIFGFDAVFAANGYQLPGEAA